MLCQNDCQRLEAENTLRIHKKYRRHALYPQYRPYRRSTQNVQKNTSTPYYEGLEVLPAAGLEPARCCHRGILSPLRLPIPPCRRLAVVVTASSKVSYLMSHFTTMDGGGFEPPKQFAADLQSVPFGHSGIHPYHKANALTM